MTLELDSYHDSVAPLNGCMAPPSPTETIATPWDRRVGVAGGRLWPSAGEGGQEVRPPCLNGSDKQSAQV